MLTVTVLLIQNTSNTLYNKVNYHFTEPMAAVTFLTNFCLWAIKITSFKIRLLVFNIIGDFLLLHYHIVYIIHILQCSHIKR